MDPMQVWRQLLPGVGVLISFLSVEVSSRLPAAPPFTLRCELKDSPAVLVRVHPASASVVLLDPGTGSEQERLQASEPSPRIPAGVLDDVRVEISDTEVRWSVTTYRPVAGSDSAQIDLRSLTYRGEGWGGTRNHADVEVVTGQCSRLEEPSR
ncbi:MAG: hypothetical protein ACKO5M_05795 [Vulcanococcus sp.]